MQKLLRVGHTVHSVILYAGSKNVFIDQEKQDKAGQISKLEIY